MRRRFLIEIVEEDTFTIHPEDLQDEISLAITQGLKIEEDISFSIEEI
ncbi:MAG: hypothetical protein JXR88_12450 [Clostridia bacterium]|nr:hypothetical protein [Clostridia bacterium]